MACVGPGAGTVLVVDDNPDVRSGIEMLLALAGYQVAIAGDGAAALAYLRCHDRPLVILLDLMMPGMSGWEFLAERRRDPQLAVIPVVVCSAVGDLDFPGLEGADEVTTKPLDPELLLHLVRRFG